MKLLKKVLRILMENRKKTIVFLILLGLYKLTKKGYLTKVYIKLFKVGIAIFEKYIKFMVNKSKKK